MSNRYFKELPPWVNFTDTWGNRPGNGKYLKRQLHKARRHYWKIKIKRQFWRGTRPHPRGYGNYRSEVNWRGW